MFTTKIISPESALNPFAEENMKRTSLIVALLVLTSLLFAGLGFLPEARATTLYVGGAGPGNYTTIQAAVDDANPGDVVFVYGGTYYENVQISKSLFMIGEDMNWTAIDGSGSGPVVEITADWVNISGFTITGGRGSDARAAGVEIDSVRSVSLVDNNISLNDGPGIRLSSSNDIVISGNMMIENGLYLRGSLPEHWNSHSIDTTNTVDGKPVHYWRNSIGGVVPGGAGQIILANCTGVTIQNQEVSNKSVGIAIGYSSDTTLSNNSAHYYSLPGIILSNSRNNTLIHNRASSIRLDYSDGNVIADNNLSGGIHVGNSNGNMIDNNTASNGGYGVVVGGSKNIVTNNTVSRNYWYGILVGGFMNTIRNNTMIESGIALIGDRVEDWIFHDISTSNTVNGKPVHYWRSTIGGTVPSGAGQVILANCTNVTIENQDVSDGSVGIQLGFSSGISIINNTVTSNGRYGIELYSSDNNTLRSNVVSENMFGVHLYNSEGNLLSMNIISSTNLKGLLLSESDNNVVIGNVISDSSPGIQVDSSDNNSIADNDFISNHGHGVRLISSRWNMIYHNNFIGNVAQAHDDDVMRRNHWNNTYPIAGNYWSNYWGDDEFSGSNQDQPGSDGIGDTAHKIHMDIIVYDRYPLMNPRIDGTPPEAGFVLINGQVSREYVLPDLPPLMLTAILDDSHTGGFAIGGAYYTPGAYDLASVSTMLPSDGSFDSPVEAAYAEIPSPAREGIYDYCVHPWDVQGNLNTSSAACARLILYSAPSSPLMDEARLTGTNLRDIDVRWYKSADDGSGENDVVRYDVFQSYDLTGPYTLAGSVPATGQPVYGWTCGGCGEGNPSNHFFYVEANDSVLQTRSPNKVGKFTRPLSKGPNLISVPLIQSISSIGTVLQTVRYDSVWFYDSSSQEWKWYMTSKDYKRGLWNVYGSTGLWVNVTEDSNLTIAGVVPAQTTIHLYEGWNLVSYPSFNSSYTVADLKVETGATRVEGYDSAPPYFLRVLGDADVLQAGYAYWIRVDADIDWMIEVS